MYFELSLNRRIEPGALFKTENTPQDPGAAARLQFPQSHSYTFVNHVKPFCKWWDLGGELISSNLISLKPAWRPESVNISRNRVPSFGFQVYIICLRFSMLFLLRQCGGAIFMEMVTIWNDLGLPTAPSPFAKCWKCLQPPWQKDHAREPLLKALDVKTS